MRFWSLEERQNFARDESFSVKYFASVINKIIKNSTAPQLGLLHVKSCLVHLNDFFFLFDFHLSTKSSNKNDCKEESIAQHDVNFLRIINLTRGKDATTLEIIF